MCGNCEYERKEFFNMTIDKINATEIKKDLYKSKSMATFTKYESGNLWYRIVTSFGTFEFPISTVELILKENDQVVDNRKSILVEGVKLSAEIGTTPFYNEIKGSELNRWIERSINNQTILIIRQILNNSHDI